MLLVLLAACKDADGANDIAGRDPPSADADAGPLTREAVDWPFSTDSPWNWPMGDGAALDGGDCTHAVGALADGAWLNAETWSHPLWRAAADDPPAAWWDAGTAVATVQTPPDAEPAGPDEEGSDRHLHVVDPTGRWVDEAWHAFPREDGDWDVDAWARNDLYGDGIGDGGVRIYGGSAVAGMIRSGEAEDGIPHALAVSIPMSSLAPEWVWPASALTTSRLDEFTGIVPIGQLVGLPADTDIDALASTASGRRVATALRDYGGYVVDWAANLALYAEPGAEDLVDPARDDLDAIVGALRCVTNNAESSPGGPGERLADLAPELEEPPAE